MSGSDSLWWSWAWPALAWAVLLVASLAGSGGLITAVAGVALLGSVFAAVYHAEVIAHRVGEPFGTLILALAVTTIETALIVSVMIAAPAEKAELARDTVFAAVMIVCNGIVGICLLMGAARYREQGFQLQGASAALAVLTALTGLTLILPNYAARELGPLYSPPQLVFAGLVSLVLYGLFVFVQTVRHRDYFLPIQTDDKEVHAPPPATRTAILSAGLLIVSLVAIVGLAKVLTPSVEFAVARLDVPKATVGIIIAVLVLLPEGLAAARTALANRLQTSLNLAVRSRPSA
jgi:Ca2+:H+ antiporter